VKIVRICLLFSILMLLALPAFSQIGTTFTYQGRLYDSGLPASGSYQLRITPFTEAEGGSALAAPVTTEVLTVTEGVFTVQLDFGPAVFLDGPVWLEIEVDSPTTDFVLLTPRQPVTPTPFAISASSVAVDGVDRSAIQDGSVNAAKVDASQIQLRITSPCADGTALQTVAQNGVPSCVPVGADRWEVLPDGRLNSEVGIRIQPQTQAEFPFTARHDSTTIYPQAALVESQANDYSRLSFYNDSDLASFWTLAGRIGGAGPQDHIFNMFHSVGGDLLSLRGDQRVGIGNSNPDAPLMIRSQGQWHPAAGNGRGDVHIGTSTVGLSFGVALGGGGAGASRIWTKGGAEQLFLGSASNPDTLSITGNQVGIANNSPTATLDVNGGLRIRGLAHADPTNRVVQVSQDGNVVAVPVPAPGTKYISYSKLEFSFAATSAIDVPVHLPDGVTWDEFTIWYIDNDPAFNLSVLPVAQNLASGIGAGYPGMESTGSSAAIRTTTVPVGLGIDNSARSYALSGAIVVGGYPAIEIIGVRVAYH